MLKRLSDDLHQRVLGWTPQDIPVAALARMQMNWQANGLTPDDPTEVVEIPYPADLGTYQEALDAAVESLGSPWLDRLDRFSRIPVPDLPTIDYLAPGWQRVAHGSDQWESCDCPSDTTMILDFETGWTSSQKQPVWHPAVCCCLDASYWYVWVANFDQPGTVIDFTSGNMIAGHNVGYDRAYLASEYLMQPSGNRFFDTMAAWIAVRGFTNQQRGLVKLDQSEDLDEWARNAMSWLDETTTSGLDAIYEFYFREELDKGVRDALVEGGWRFIRDNLRAVVKYCLMDCRATLQVFQSLYPEWCNLQPSAINRTAQLLLGNTWLPLSPERFPAYYGNAEAAMQETLKEATASIEARIKMIVEQSQAPLALLVDRLKTEKVPMAKRPEMLQQWLAESWTKHLPEQLQLLDWTPAMTGKNKGLPKWYREIQAKGQKRLAEGKPTRISIGWREVPLVLGMTWRGEPILYGQLPDKPEAEGFYTAKYGSLPHPEERGKAVSALFAKGFVKAVEDGVLGGLDGNVKGILDAAMSVVNWVSLRKRVRSIHTESPEGFPVVLPQITVTGTITRRCADNLWQVASNPKRKRIGTELKSMVEAPPGYKIVGADIDAEEAWIASTFADSVLGYCGSSALGLSSIIGSKEAGTDIHSLQAKASGLKRDYAKNLVYGCVPLASQALTRRGWKAYQEIRVGDEILAYDRESKTTKWAPIEHLTYHDSALVIRSQTDHNYSHLSTPDHRWIVERRTSINKERVYVEDERTTLNLTKDCNIVTAATNVEVNSLLTPDEASVLGWLLSDGYFSWSNCTSGRTSQKSGDKRGVEACITQKKQPQRAIIEGLLASEDALVNTYDYPDRPCVQYQLKPQYVRDLWVKAGLNPGQEEFCPVILGLSTVARKAFLEAFWMAEGHIGSGCFILSQNSGDKLDAVILCATLLGYQVRTSLKEITAAGNEHYSVRLIPRQHVTAQRLQQEEVGYMAVWCPTTKYGTWVMRQGKTITITGNCIYGLGLAGATNTLAKNLPGVPIEQCQSFAQGFLKTFKGVRSQATGRYVGGIASDAFNVMDKIASAKVPTTPVLKAKISHALRGTRDFATTRTNWCIQSSGSDWRDMWVVLMAYLFDRYGIEGRLLMTIHDEARFLVREDQTVTAAWLLQVAHLMIRAAFIEALGLDCIPASVAWHSGIDVDTVLRKDPSDPQITPSQPTAIEPGETWMPKDLLEKILERTPKVLI